MELLLSHNLCCIFIFHISCIKSMLYVSANQCNVDWDSCDRFVILNLQFLNAHRKTHVPWNTCHLN